MRKPVALLGLLAGLTCAPLSLNASDDKPLTTVADLRYGLVLYDYYQDNFFDAISELLVAEIKGGIKGHGDNPELIAGGIALSFGMDQQAGKTFEKLLDESKPLNVRNAAWYYLAKLQNQRGDWQTAQLTLENISGELEPALVESAIELTTVLSVKAGKMTEAEALAAPILKKPSSKSALPAYLYYNLGAAYARDEQYTKAGEYFAPMAELKFSRDPVVQREQLALYDKALTSYGYSHLLQEDYVAAIEAFGLVRRDSFFSSEALLGLGWAYYQQEEYLQALAPWQMLSERSLIYPSTQEALLAIADSYEKLEAKPRALSQYQLAEDTFNKELDLLNDLSQELQGQSMITRLALDVRENQQASWLIDDATKATQPFIVYLQTLFAENEFQSLTQTLRDLYLIQERLQAWQETLIIFDELMVNRQQKRLEQQAQLADSDYQPRLNEARKAHESLVAELNIAKANDSVWSFLKGPTEELAERAFRAEKTVEQLAAAGEDVTFERELAKRFKGLLLWQVSDDFPARIWKIESSLEPVTQLLDDAQKTQNRVSSIASQQPDILPYRQSIAQSQERLEAELAKTDTLIARLDGELRGKVVNEIGRQQSRLQYYLGESKLAIARLYDQALLEQEP